MTNKNTYTLITGAGAGLGRAFAIQSARMGRNVILLSLPGSNIGSFAAQLMHRYAVKAQVFEFDLTDSDALQQHISDITRHYEVDWLINNAGVGGTSAFVGTSLEQMDRIIQLNVRCTALLTRLLMPHLLRNKKSYLLNVSSMAAFTPIAYKTVYPASKSFISSFSLGLREEMKGTGLSVSVLYPGPIMTNSGTTRRIILQGAKGRWGLLSVSRLAETGIRQTLAGRPVIIPGIINKINHFLLHLLPLGLRLRWVSSEVRKEMS